MSIVSCGWHSIKSERYLEYTVLLVSVYSVCYLGVLMNLTKFLFQASVISTWEYDAATVNLCHLLLFGNKEVERNVVSIIDQYCVCYFVTQEYIFLEWQVQLQRLNNVCKHSLCVSFLDKLWFCNVNYGLNHWDTILKFIRQYIIFIWCQHLYWEMQHDTVSLLLL